MGHHRVVCCNVSIHNILYCTMYTKALYNTPLPSTHDIINNIAIPGEVQSVKPYTHFSIAKHEWKVVVYCIRFVTYCVHCKHTIENTFLYSECSCILHHLLLPYVTRDEVNGTLLCCLNGKCTPRQSYKCKLFTLDTIATALITACVDVTTKHPDYLRLVV